MKNENIIKNPYYGSLTQVMWEYFFPIKDKFVKKEVKLTQEEYNKTNG